MEKANAGNISDVNGPTFGLRHYATGRKVPGSIPGDFFRGIRQFHVPGVDSTSKNEYQNTHGVKTAGAYG
jgi:hypothetical protein